MFVPVRRDFMTRIHTAIVVLAAASFGLACVDKAAQEKNAALEQRIAELEKQVSPSPVPLENTLPAEGDLASPAPPSEGTIQAAEPQKPAVRTPAKPATTARREPSRPAPAPPVRSDPNPPQEARTEEPDFEPEPEPEPRREAAPRAEPLILPEGTELTLVLESPLSSAVSQEGDAVTARVEKAVSDDGRIALPGGSVLRGKVVEAASAGRVKGRARLAVAFDSITVRGRRHELQATLITAEAPDTHGRDAKIAGGAAAAGAVIGAIAGGKEGAAKGAVIGGVVGGGAVLATKGGEIELPAGSRWKVRLRDSLRL
jgi:type IV secretory pathway VirB10-like protein